MGLAERELARHAAISSSCCFNLPGRFGFGRTPVPGIHLGNALLTRFNLPGRFGFGRTRSARRRCIRAAIVFQSARQIWVWPNPPCCMRSRARPPTCFNLPGRFGFGRTRGEMAAIKKGKKFQSARQIWVWPNRAGMPRSLMGAMLNSFNLPGRFGFGRTSAISSSVYLTSVSICQADLGLAEPPATSGMSAALTGFQSARQIWVWPNRIRSSPAPSNTVSICQADLGLAEPPPLIRITLPSALCFNLPGRFGFGRTKNEPSSIETATTVVSICQADLGLAELYVELSAHLCQKVSICQADLGLAERHSQHATFHQVIVSICQADLGLAEPAEQGSHANRTRVSICQADLGLAEPNQSPAALSQGY